MVLTKIKRNVCIVGSGFCGFAAYKKLKEDNVELILIEGGDIKTPESSRDQPFYKVISNEVINFKKKIKVKNRLDPSFKDRKFTLGGSSECWTGWIKPFEKSTYNNIFSSKVNQSWGNLNLEKHNKKVLSLLNSPIYDFDPYVVAKDLNVILPKLKNGLNYTTYAWAENPLRLKSFWNKKILNKKNFESINKNQDVVTGYKLIDFLKNGKNISELIFKNKAGEIMRVEAEYYLLCMGGIENARFAKKLFENSEIISSSQKIIGNFQEHPHLYNVAYFNSGKKILPKILTNRILIKNQSNKFLNNGSIKIAIKAWDGAGTPKVTFHIYKKERKFINGVQNILRGTLKRTLIPNADYWITMRCEQSPNDRSRLNFDVKKTYLDWEVSDSDFYYYSKYLREFASFLKVNDFAKDFRLSYDSKENLVIPPQIYGGAHHMGTVPFLQDKSLINENFKLSILNNVYMVGSSTFPTSGFENPTHAAMATTLLACDDLLKEIKNKLI